MQISKGETEPSDAIRDHLLILTADDLLDTALVHRLTDADLATCDGYSDNELRGLPAGAGALRAHGRWHIIRRVARRPSSETGAALCGCGRAHRQR